MRKLDGFRFVLLAVGALFGQTAFAQTTTGISISVADWLPHWDPETGGWGVVPAGSPASKWLVFSSNAAATVAPGTYDVYWVQDADHTDAPMRIAEAVTVAAGAITDVLVSTGMSIVVADWVPALDPDVGYWGAAPADDMEAPFVNWTWGAGMAMVLPPGEYDFWWDADDTDDFPPIWLHQVTVGNYGGLGIEIQDQDGRIVVVNTAIGGAANLAGLAPGDAITRVDGAPLNGIGLDAAVAMMRGEVGTTVALTIERAVSPERSITVARQLVGAIEQITVGAGLRAVPDPSLPPLSATGGWWGAVFAGDAPDAIATQANDTKAPLLVGRASYDIYWVQDPVQPPRLVAENVPAIPGQIVDVPIPAVEGSRPVK